MAQFGKRLDGPGGRRRAERKPILMAAAIHTAGGSRTVSLLDVSTAGARLRTQPPLAAGQEVWLKIPPSDVFAKVQWVDDDLCGIVFDEPLPAAEAARLQSAGKVVLMPGLTSDEQLALEDWQTGFTSR